LVGPRTLKSSQQDDIFYARLWETITAGEVWKEELVNKTKYGELYEAKHTIIPVTDKNGTITHFVGIAADITEEVLTRQALGVLNRVMRHNLRNALNVIDGHAELLEDEDLDSKARQASIAAIRNQAASMQKIGEKTAEIRSVWDASETPIGRGSGSISTQLSKRISDGIRMPSSLITGQMITKSKFGTQSCSRMR